MPIPDYQTLMRPVLRLADERERPVRECVDLVADEFSLSAEEREALLPSGKQTTLANRIHWAVTYMVNAGLLQRPRRGVIAATARGRTVLEQFPDRIDNDVLGRFSEFPEFLSRSRAKPTADGDEPVPQLPLSADKDTPEERIETALVHKSAVRRLGQGDGGAYRAALPTLDARCPTSSMNHAVTRSLERATASRTGPPMTGRCSSAAA